MQLENTVLEMHAFQLSDRAFETRGILPWVLRRISQYQVVTIAEGSLYDRVPSVCNYS